MSSVHSPLRPSGREANPSKETTLTTRRFVGAIVGALILALGLLVPAGPAQAETAAPSVTATETACGVDLTFDNPTRWRFSFDYRVDGEQPSAPVEPELIGLTIKEGPRAGQEFLPRYQVVTVEPGETKTVDVRFDAAGEHTVTYWLNRGPEQKLFLADATAELDVPETCEPTPDPTTDPTVPPTTGPTADPTGAPTAGPTAGPGAPGGGGGGSLPVTGAGAAGLAAGAVLLLAVGVVLFLVGRRRRVTFTS